MNEKALVICSVYIEDDGFNEIEYFENVSEVKQITNIETEETYLEFVMNNEINEYSLDYTEWFRYVSSDSHLANYVKKSERFDCEWDEKGNKI